MVVSALLCSAIAYILVSPARALGGGRFVSAWSSVFWFRVLDMEFGVEGFGLRVMGFGCHSAGIWACFCRVFCRTSQSPLCSDPPLEQLSGLEFPWQHLSGFWIGLGFQIAETLKAHAPQENPKP